MDLNKNLGTNVSILFLLGLTIVSATVYYVANGARDKIENDVNRVESYFQV
ncbi:MAG: hypothetical protein Q7S34_01270 [bacterium]|nr:hypothetical protein [bacterium]